MITHTPVYKDTWFKIGGCLAISEITDSIGRDESLVQRLGTKHFYVDLLGGFVIALLIWEVSRMVIIRLDRKYDWLEKPLKRISLQLLLGVVSAAILSFLLTMAYMRLMYNQDIFQTTWLNNEFYAVILFIVLVNVAYFSWWLYSKMKSKPAETAKPAIEVAKLGRTVLLSQTDIACAYLNNNYCYIKPFNGDGFVTTYSLDELGKMLDGNGFFRVNRQVLVNRRSCTSYKSIENGKIEVELNPPLKYPVIVSQKRASEFRKWVSSN